MFSPEKVLAAFVTAACVVAFIRLCLGAQRRRRFDQVMRRWWLALKGLPQRLRQRPMSKKEAAMLAQDAIERARQRSVFCLYRVIDQGLDGTAMATCFR